MSEDIRRGVQSPDHVTAFEVQSRKTLMSDRDSDIAVTVDGEKIMIPWGWTFTLVPICHQQRWKCYAKHKQFGKLVDEKQSYHADPAIALQQVLKDIIDHVPEATLS